MKGGNVVIGKISPPKFLSEAREISIQNKKKVLLQLEMMRTGL